MGNEAIDFGNDEAVVKAVFECGVIGMFPSGYAIHVYGTRTGSEPNGQLLSVCNPCETPAIAWHSSRLHPEVVKLDEARNEKLARGYRGVHARFEDGEWRIVCRHAGTLAPMGHGPTEAAAWLDQGWASRMASEVTAPVPVPGEEEEPQDSDVCDCGHTSLKHVWGTDECDACSCARFLLKTSAAHPVPRESGDAKPLDCRSEEGETVGLIDAAITIFSQLSKRSLTESATQEALKDLFQSREMRAAAPHPPAGFEEFWAVYSLTPEAHQDSQRDARAAWLASRTSQPEGTEYGQSYMQRWWENHPRPTNIPDGAIWDYLIALETRVRWLETGIWCGRETITALKAKLPSPPAQEPGK